LHFYLLLMFCEINDNGDNPPAFQAKLSAKLISNVQLFFFSFLKWMNNWQIYCIQSIVYSLSVVYTLYGLVFLFKMNWKSNNTTTASDCQSYPLWLPDVSTTTYHMV